MRRPKSIAEVNHTALDLQTCIAKTYRTENGENQLGRTVLEHCCIVGDVAKHIIKRLPDWLRDKFFPIGSELIAAAHDVGKICPTFQEKIRRPISGYVKNSLVGLEQADPELEKEWGYHGGVSQATAQFIKSGPYIPIILGQHHGYTPSLNGKNALAEIFGGEPWQTQREAFLRELKQIFNMNWPTVGSTVQAKVLSGLTTVSDWIGSSSLFENPKDPSDDIHIENALDKAGFLSPQLKEGLSFFDIFNFHPHPTQQQLGICVNKPGIYILEAPMGHGKTEAALFAAYSIMASGDARGIYFALPTQLTSDKIYDRMNQFLKKILEDDCIHKKSKLLHGNAWLKDTEMGEDGQPGGSWFQGSKRGILAPFAVGTVDQALMAVMNVKHGFVRTFGLAGKVVILDEVHSYDLYTGTILTKLVETLRELSCTVIILSATLNSERRQELLGQRPTKNDYPLISVCNETITLKEITIAPLPIKKTSIFFCNDNKQAIEEALYRAEQGQQVLWIENTVTEAQFIYKQLGSRATSLNIRCGLVHSQFLKTDREKNEQKWVALFGKEGMHFRQKQGRILIGTQVLEQSLDIDADFLITNICPTDMLLQRIGRLWRHQQTQRHPCAVQEAWILAPNLLNARQNKKSFGKTAKIYSPYILCRTLEIWEPLTEILLPINIRALIEATYCKRQETAEMRQYKQELDDQSAKLQRLALVGLSEGGSTLPENKASTRYSEQESVEVLLLRNYRWKEDGSGTTVTLLTGESIDLPLYGKSQNRNLWREKASILAKNTVRVASHLAPKALSLKELEWLGDYFYLGNREYSESMLRIAKVLDSGELIGFNSGLASDVYHLQYDTALGYQTKKIQ